MNYKLLATQVAESLKYSTTINGINRSANAIFNFKMKDYHNNDITSSRSYIIYNWILSLSEQPITNEKKKLLLTKFLELISPVNDLSNLIKFVDESFNDKNNDDDISYSIIERIWNSKSNFRLFISHIAKFKTIASNLKNNLLKFSISAFVAHEDIEPTEEWQNEIEFALFSADALIALMTENFHDSKWTDQEIGIAIGRRIPVISIKLGTDPYGFVGKYQALKIYIDKEYIEIVGLLLKKSDKMVDVFIEQVKNSSSWAESNSLACLLSYIDYLNKNQISSLLEAYKNNTQVYNSMGFNGHKTKNGYKFGKGLFYELERITGEKYNPDDYKQS